MVVVKLRVRFKKDNYYYHEYAKTKSVKSIKKNEKRMKKHKITNKLSRQKGKIQEAPLKDCDEENCEYSFWYTQTHTQQIEL